MIADPVKVTAFVRVGVDRHASTTRGRKPKVTASAKLNEEPFYNNQGDAVPTVAFAVELDLPAAMFRQAETVIASMTIPEESATIAAKVRQ